MAKPEPQEKSKAEPFTSAEMGALAHLYRGEVYRSTLWRTRLDNTTNWAVVTLGIALSVSYSSANASPLPLLFVGLLVVVFLIYEARRYRYFNVWRARARWLETHFYVPMLRGKGTPLDDGWHETLAHDYEHPEHHIGFRVAAGRRLRRSYAWILVVQVIAYFCKLAIHPVPADTFTQIIERAAIGPVSGWLVIALGLVFNGTWIGFAYYTWKLDLERRAERKAESNVTMG